ncbi:MAG: hypothetical protein H6676_05570 [Thermoflexaceae bacterium]|nr:hypothetical protein [Thermoflexaceae bacterium]
MNTGTTKKHPTYRVIRSNRENHRKVQYGNLQAVRPTYAKVQTRKRKYSITLAAQPVTRENDITSTRQKQAPSNLPEGAGIAMTRRTERVNELLREELSARSRASWRKTRGWGVASVTVTEVQTAPDLRAATVFVSPTLARKANAGGCCAACRCRSISSTTNAAGPAAGARLPVPVRPLDRAGGTAGGTGHARERRGRRTRRREAQGAGTQRDPLVDKPGRWNEPRRSCPRCQRFLSERRIGHTGTRPGKTAQCCALAATRHLVEEMTRRITAVHQGEIRLGVATGFERYSEHGDQRIGQSSGDESLETQRDSSSSVIERTPPAFSAIQSETAGVRSTARTREHRALELAARRVTVHGAALQRPGPSAITMSVHCGRELAFVTLARDASGQRWDMRVIFRRYSESQ